MALPRLDITPDPIDVDAEIEHLVGRKLAAEFNHTDLKAGEAADTSRRDITVLTGLIGDDEAVRPPRWRPTTTDDAEWCMGRLAEAQATLDSLATQRDAFIQRAEDAFWRQAAYWRRTAAFFNAHLTQWGINQRDEAEAAAAAAGRKSFPKTLYLPSGDVATRRATEPTVKITLAHAVLDWALDQCPDAVTTKQEVKVTDLREHVAIRPLPDASDPDDPPMIIVRRMVDPDDPGVVTYDDGVIVPGVAIEWPRTTATPKPHAPGA